MPAPGELPTRYDVVLIRSDEGYAVHCPALPPCWSQGATREEALENIRDAIAEYLDYRGEKAAELIAEARREGCRVAPGRARAYAKAMGQAAKTDPLDARRLARRPPRVAARVRERNRLEQGKSFAVKDFRFRHLDWLDREIEQRERQYKKLLESSQSLAPAAKLYCSVRGVGIHTAAILLAWLPERGRGTANP